MKWNKNDVLCRKNQTYIFFFHGREDRPKGETKLNETKKERKEGKNEAVTKITSQLKQNHYLVEKLRVTFFMKTN